MVTNHVDTSTIPVKSEYTLTESGRECVKIIKDIKKWALKCNIKNKDCELKDCRKCEF